MLEHRHITKAAVLAVLSFAVANAQVPANWATVTGQVLDFDNRPVVGARIVVLPLDSAVSGGMPGTTTDSEGRYRLASPPFPGRTRLCAVKESAGYPNTQYLLFTSANGNRVEVNLTAAPHLEGFDIHLGPPDGILEATVVDSETGKAVTVARVILQRNNPDAISSETVPSDGRFLYALPPAPITIKVTAPGYAPWQYRDNESGAESLLLNSGDRKKIIVRLMPVKSEQHTH